MLICDDIVRDTLCRELISASNAAKANVMSDVMPHLENMVSILMSPRDFVYVADDVTLKYMVSQLGES